MNINRHEKTFQVTNNTINCDFWNISNWEYWNYKLFLECSTTLPTFVDVGAWIGPFTLFAAQCYSNVIAFEPDDIAFAELDGNVKLNNYTNVKVYQTAISNYDGTIILGGNKIYSNGARGISTTTMLYDTQETITVPCKTLRTVYVENKLSTGTFLKIDIEGAEYNILDDIEFFATNKPTILLE